MVSFFFFFFFSGLCWSLVSVLTFSLQLASDGVRPLIHFPLRPPMLLFRNVVDGPIIELQTSLTGSFAQRLLRPRVTPVSSSDILTRWPSTGAILTLPPAGPSHDLTPNHIRVGLGRSGPGPARGSPAGMPPFLRGRPRGVRSDMMRGGLGRRGRSRRAGRARECADPARGGGRGSTADCGGRAGMGGAKCRSGERQRGERERERASERDSPRSCDSQLADSGRDPTLDPSPPIRVQLCYDFSTSTTPTPIQQQQQQQPPPPHASALATRPGWPTRLWRRGGGWGGGSVPLAPLRRHGAP